MEVSSVLGAYFGAEPCMVSEGLYKNEIWVLCQPDTPVEISNFSKCFFCELHVPTTPSFLLALR